MIEPPVTAGGCGLLPFGSGVILAGTAFMITAATNTSAKGKPNGNICRIHADRTSSDRFHRLVDKHITTITEDELEAKISSLIIM
jgi:hypothetical protein